VFHCTPVEQEPEPIVLEVPDPVGVPAEFLGDEVHGFAPGVGATGTEEGENFRFPSLDGLGQAEDLGGAGDPGQLVEALETVAGLSRTLGLVGPAELLFDRPGPAHLVAGIATAQTGSCCDGTDPSGDRPQGQPAT
jgi:hypothetical protein